VTWDGSKGESFGEYEKREEDEIGSLEKNRRSHRYLE
jgi:hypothetical protein